MQMRERETLGDVNLMRSFGLPGFSYLLWGSRNDIEARGRRVEGENI